MNIKRFIDQNRKLIWRIIIIIVFALFVIKSLNSYYEEDEKRKKIATNTSINNSVNNNENKESLNTEENNLSTKNNTIEKTMEAFVNYCNNRQIDNAYEMLTDECKNAMYNTVEQFDKIYVKNVFNEEKEYSMTKWATNGDIITYQIKFIGDILSTGGVGKISQEYYTFVKTDESYKINVNNYIYGKIANKEYEKNGIGVKIKNIDIYDSYEQYEISFTNNTSKEISLTGNKYVKNIYLENSKGTTYSSLNSNFENEEITIKPGNTKNYIIKFNKNYNPQNQVTTLVLSDVIFDYKEYLNVENKNDYKNRAKVEINF